MNFDEGSTPRRTIWIYGYELIPPITHDRIGPMKALLDTGHAKAGPTTLIWESRLINGGSITHILVVSDRPDQDLEVNRLVEAELDRLDAPYAITRAVSVGARSGPEGTVRASTTGSMADA